MKKLLLVIMLAASGLAQADYYREYRHYGHRDVYVQQTSGADVIVPLVIGGIVGAAIANSNRPETVVVQQQSPVIIQREQPLPPREPQMVCYGWKEIQTPDGAIYRERSCYYR